MTAKLVEFLRVFALYRKHNPVRHAARIAYEIAFRGAPF